MASPRSVHVPMSPRQMSPSAANPRAARTDYRMEPENFSQEVVALKACIRGYSRLALKISASGDTGLMLQDGTKFGRQNLRTMLSNICLHLDRFSKVFRASAGKGKKSTKTTTTGAKPRGSQLNGLFYVSDQFLNFIQRANKGNGLAPLLNDQRVDAATRGAWAIARCSDTDQAAALAFFDQLGGVEQVAASLGMAGFERGNVDVNFALNDLLFNRRMATSGILVTLLHLIVQVNGLQSAVNGQRVTYDAVWEDSFQNVDTHFYLGGRDISGALVAGVQDGSVNLADYTNTADQLKSLSDHVQNCGKSAFQRLQERPAIVLKRKEGPVSYPTFIARTADGSGEWGIIYAMFMVLISYHRIPGYLVPEAAQQFASVTQVGLDGVSVETNQNIVDAGNLSNYVSALLDVHRQINEPRKKAAREGAARVARQAKAAAKKSTTGKPAAFLSLPTGSNSSGLPLPM